MFVDGNKKYQLRDLDFNEKNFHSQPQTISKKIMSDGSSLSFSEIVPTDRHDYSKYLMLAVEIVFTGLIIIRFNRIAKKINASYSDAASDTDLNLKEEIVIDFY